MRESSLNRFCNDGRLAAEFSRDAIKEPLLSENSGSLEQTTSALTSASTLFLSGPDSGTQRFCKVALCF